MVQYKRKPVKPEPLPAHLDDSSEVWVIEQTGEVFTDYEKYLDRCDFYKQKNFTCESTGHQGYTFYEALESEIEASKEINSRFPEVLRGRVLAFVQHRVMARMDDLVNLVFEEFREMFVVGDRVTVEHDGHRVAGHITFMLDSRGNATRGHFPGEYARGSTYYIRLDNTGEQITRFKAADLARERDTYSKLVLKQFLRSALVRETWIGAPWIVKEHLVKKYHLESFIECVPLVACRFARKVFLCPN